MHRVHACGRSRRLALILPLTLILIAPTAPTASAQSGVQLTPDGKRSLVSKDVGGERWAITLNPDGSVTGNVFRPGGGDPQFVWCEELRRRVDGDDAIEVTLACSGADRCPLAPCSPSEWTLLTDVTLAEAFFFPPATAAAARMPERVLGSDGSSVPGSGVQRTPDEKRTLISKDVGSERWAITLHTDDHSVTGNVFTAGRDPQFVWCSEREANGGQVEYTCLGADRCAGTPCPATDWTLIADVVLPETFFAPPELADLDAVVQQVLTDFGDEDGFVAVALAADRGYSLAQILRAVLSGRLHEDGAIAEKSGAPETPANPPPGVFSPSAAASRVMGVSDLVRQLGDRLGASLSPEQRTRVLIALLNRGYTLSQIARIGVDAGVESCAEAPTAAEFQTCVDTFGDIVALTDASGVVPPGDDSAELLPPPPGPCNLNGRRQPGEECDGSDHNGETCASLPGFVGGQLHCTDECTFDASGCRREGQSVCGDGEKDVGEDCEGTDLGGQTCATLGALFPGNADFQFSGGTLGCTTNHPGPCRYVTTGCLRGGLCGNGQLELGEPCDLAADGTPLLGGATCANLVDRFPRDGFGKFVGGTLGCIVVPGGSCEFDIRNCRSAGTEDCGNGVIEGNEECDGASLGVTECKDLGEGWVRGTLTCLNVLPGRQDDCLYDRDQCKRDSLCGNGVIEGDEECDGSSLSVTECKDLGEGWLRGELTCFDPEPGHPSPYDCHLNRDQCRRDSECGNGTIEGNEECDRFEFGDRTCESEGLGEPGGTLICDPATCLIDRDNSCKHEQRCGDDFAEGTEVCDGADHRGEDCESRGYVGGGVLECVNCQFVETGCFRCDGRAAEGNEACDGSDLRGNDCTTIGRDYDGGELACRADCTDFDVSGCTHCNGVLCPDGCAPPGYVCCDDGGACAPGSTCVPGGCCPSDGVICAFGGCFPPGATCCAGGYACDSGYVCAPGGCCPVSAPVPCEQNCMPANAVCCPGGYYCPAGYSCGAGRTCFR